MVLRLSDKETGCFAIPALYLAVGCIKTSSFQQCAFEQDPELIPAFFDYLANVHMMNVEHVVALQDLFAIQPDRGIGI